MMMPIAPIEKTVSINDVSLSEPSVISGGYAFFTSLFSRPSTKGPPYEYNRVRLGFQWAVFIPKEA